MKGKFLVALLLMVVTFILSRWPGLIPRSFSGFSAAYAIVFCAGVFFRRRSAPWILLAVFVVADLVLNIFYYHVQPFHSSMLPNYLAYAAVFFIGRKFSGKAHWFKLVGGGLLGALLFYLITNTASWLELPYPKTFSGWIQALTTGLPGYPPTWEFFRNTLLSGGLFTGLFAGAMKASESSEEVEETAEESEEEPAAKPEEAKA